MSAGMSTFIVLLVWALPIVIAVAFMAVYYREPTAAELEEYDRMQPDEVPPTPEALAEKT